MIKKLTFKNYKSYLKKQEIDFGKVTILIGPNNSGKSSIIKLLALLKQSLVSNNQLESSFDSISFNAD